MVNFELVSGDRSRFRPDERGVQTIDVSKSFIFPTRWLVYHLRHKNVGVDDTDLFVREVSLSKMLLIDILSRPKEYEKYDFVVLSSEGDKSTVHGYLLKEDGAVQPFVNTTKLKLPKITKLVLASDGLQVGGFGGPYTTVHSYNQAMLSYYENYGLVLRNTDLRDDFPTRSKCDSITAARNAWLAEDSRRMSGMRQERIRKRREEKLREYEEKEQSNSKSDESGMVGIPEWMKPSKRKSETFY